MFKIIDDKLLSETSKKAIGSERKRMNYNIHESLDDPINRLLNAIEPESYVKPHKHEDPDKREIFVVLKGKLAVIEFNDRGNILSHCILDPKSGVHAIEIPARAWHTIISLESGSVVIEFKDGPYKAINDKNFASWAPDEGSPEALNYNQRLLKELGIRIAD